MARQFTTEPGLRRAIPLFIGIVGPSGSGKTRSAFRLAAGIAEVDPGEVVFINTEGNRGLADIDHFKKPDGSPLITHMPFAAPYASLDYLDAITQARAIGAKTIVIDSMSHEHEQEGGMLDFQDQELRRLAKDDYGTWKADKYNMLAWQAPKAARRRLLTRGIMQTDVNIIACFRAKETSKPVRKDNKTVIETMGFTPIAGDEFVYEMALSCLLMPGSRGFPTWDSQFAGERLAMKRNDHLASILPDGEQLSERIGRDLAMWARGGTAPDETPWAKYSREVRARMRGTDGLALLAWWRETQAERAATGASADSIAKAEQAVTARADALIAEQAQE